MLYYLFTLVVAINASGLLAAPTGTIQGTVVNGTHGDQPLKNVEVVLRAGSDAALVPVAETIADRYGNFVFEQVPLDPTLVYLPGANHEGVHYPGRRVRLNSGNRVEHSEIVAFDAVAAPCPLVATRHDIEVTVEEHVLKITESLQVANPTRTTYVGQSMGNGPPVTFWLSIPTEFDRVTFDKEFYGRRFFVVEHRPVTDMPWMPGNQEMRFTYRVPLVKSAGRFRRTLDIPSEVVRVRVNGADKQQVSCNLPRAESENNSWSFGAAGKRLESSYTIELQIASLPFPWMQYARWASVVVLVSLTGTMLLIPSLRRRLSKSQQQSNRRRSLSRKAAA